MRRSRSRKPQCRALQLDRSVPRRNRSERYVGHPEPQPPQRSRQAQPRRHRVHQGRSEDGKSTWSPSLRSHHRLGYRLLKPSTTRTSARRVRRRFPAGEWICWTTELRTCFIQLVSPAENSLRARKKLSLASGVILIVAPSLSVGALVQPLSHKRSNLQLSIILESFHELCRRWMAHPPYPQYDKSLRRWA